MNALTEVNKLIIQCQATGQCGLLTAMKVRIFYELLIRMLE